MIIYNGYSSQNTFGFQDKSNDSKKVKNIRSRTTKRATASSQKYSKKKLTPANRAFLNSLGFKVKP